MAPYSPRCWSSLFSADCYPKCSVPKAPFLLHIQNFVLVFPIILNQYILLLCQWVLAAVKAKGRERSVLSAAKSSCADKL